MTRQRLPIGFERPLPGGSVHGRKGNRWIVVRLHSGTAEQAISTARLEAQVALDIIAAKLGEFVELDAPETDNLAWWATADGARLRATHLSLLEAPKFHASLRIGRADGSLVPEAPTVWHPVLRFYRLAYLTDDPIERFRYLYLAIENAVSTVSPKGPAEGEPAWLQRVLASLNPPPNWTAVIGRPVPPGTDAIRLVVDIVYTQTRLPSFHAKSGQTLLLPADRDAMAKAAETGLIAHRLVHVLAPHAGYEIRGSGYFQSGFRLLADRSLVNATIQFSADTRPFNPADEEFTLSEHPPVVLTPVPIEYSGFLCLLRAAVEKPNATIARVGIVTPEYPLSATCYETELRPDGLSALELVMGVRMTQPGT